VDSTIGGLDLLWTRPLVDSIFGGLDLSFSGLDFNWTFAGLDFRRSRPPMDSTSVGLDLCWTRPLMDSLFVRLHLHLTQPLTNPSFSEPCSPPQKKNLNECIPFILDNSSTIIRVVLELMIFCKTDLSCLLMFFLLSTNCEREVHGFFLRDLSQINDSSSCRV
jgi:hypothetical protein